MKRKKHTIFISMVLLLSMLFTPNVSAVTTNETTNTTTTTAETTTSTSKTKNTKLIEIDWTNPITVSVVGFKDVDTFTVKYENYEFDVSLFGIDTVTNMTVNGETKGDYDKDNYTKLLKSNSVTLELDSKKNMYNKNGELQAWVWTQNSLFQNELVSKGLATLDNDICSYSLCNKYYDVLKSSQDNAEQKLAGLWGAEDYTLNYNVGGNKEMLSLNGIELGLIIAAGVMGVIVLISIILVVKSSKKKKKNNTEKIKATEEEVESVEENVEKSIETQEASEKIDEFLNLEEKNNTELSEEAKLEAYLADKLKQEQEKNIESEIQEDNLKLEEITEEIKSTEPEIIYDKDGEVIDATGKTILVNFETTLFSPKDPRAKETPEATKFEMVIVDDDLNSQKYAWYIKPMRNSKLSPYCKERSDVTQINVNNGSLFEDVMLGILPLLKQCDNIYSWGKGAYLQFDKEGFEKLNTNKYYELMDILKEKYINYKEDFAERNEITPCSLVKAADLCDEPKEKDAVDTMLNIYKIERM